MELFLLVFPRKRDFYLNLVLWIESLLKSEEKHRHILSVRHAQGVFLNTLAQVAVYHFSCIIK